MSVAAESIVGGYRVVRPLGRGATAVVLEATGPDGERVALKLSDEPRFLRGAQAQAGLTHRAIVRVRAHGTDPEYGPWLAMDLIDGPTLAAARVRFRAFAHRLVATMGTAKSKPVTVVVRPRPPLVLVARRRGCAVSLRPTFPSPCA